MVLKEAAVNKQFIKNYNNSGYNVKYAIDENDDLQYLKVELDIDDDAFDDSYSLLSPDGVNFYINLGFSKAGRFSRRSLNNESFESLIEDVINKLNELNNQ